MMWNLRTCNLQHYQHWHKAMSTTKHLKRRSRVEVKVNFRQNSTRYCWILVVLLFSSFTSVRTPSLVSLSSCFHPISMILLERSTGITPKHQSTNTAKVSQVSNTTGTPLCSIFVHRFEAWSHTHPSQAPGLGSFISNFIVSQVDVHNCRVDFQCFGKCLWTTRMANHVKHKNLQCNLRQHTTFSITTQLKSTNSWSKDREKSEEIKVNFSWKDAVTSAYSVYLPLFI